MKYEKHLDTPAKHLALLLSHLEIHDDDDDQEEGEEEGNNKDADDGDYTCSVLTFYHAMISNHCVNSKQ